MHPLSKFEPEVAIEKELAKALALLLFCPVHEAYPDMLIATQTYWRPHEIQGFTT